MITYKILRNTGLYTALAICLFLPQTVLAGVAVIVNPASPLSTVEAGEIKKVFLAKSKKISGHIIKPIDNGEGDIRDKFLISVVGKKPRVFKSHWIRLIFSGKSAPLKSGGDDAGVKKWVSSHIDAIGFIDNDNVDDTVKVIFKVD